MKIKIDHESRFMSNAGIFLIHFGMIYSFLIMNSGLQFGIPYLQGPTREKEKREKERSELRDLVNILTSF